MDQINSVPASQNIQVLEKADNKKVIISTSVNYSKI